MHRCKEVVCLDHSDTSVYKVRHQKSGRDITMEISDALLTEVNHGNGAAIKRLCAQIHEAFLAEDGDFCHSYVGMPDFTLELLK